MTSFADFGEPPRAVRGRRRSMPWFLSGALCILAVVAFFWWYALRDSATLEHGDRTTGTIVGLIQPQDWDPMDSGRLVVRYEIYGETRESKIWIDNELGAYAVGQRVPVYVRGSHVRTDRENNDPEPLGSAAVLIGLAGLALIVRGVVVRLRRDDVQVVGDATVLALQSWGLGRRSAIELTRSGEVRIRAPGFFGSHRLVVSATEVAVEALEDPLSYQHSEATDDDFYFEEPIVLLDLPTKTQIAAPNLVLGFAQPVRVPPVRLILALQNPFPFSWRASRSTKGVYADGVILRSRSPREAASALESAGATRVPDLVTWLAARRRLVTDPVRIAQLAAEDAQLVRRSRLAFWAWLSAGALLLVAKVTETWWTFGLAFASVGLGFLLDHRKTASSEH
ncbi:MAG: hypothetical protein QOI82_2002 [Actinomycetota bacterium]|jgi:hypothetical protein|nr:hypothetical protein [Actinomycetota bacterium]